MPQTKMIRAFIGMQSLKTFAMLLPLLLIFLLSSCATVPVQEFSTYKNNFNEAKKAAETVILDYAAAKKKLVDERAEKEGAIEPAVPLRDQPFDVDKLVANADPVDYIAIRMKAWDVVSRYNDVLTSLVEGKRGEEVTAETKSLVAAMGDFPVKGLQDAAAQISPAMGLLTTVLSEMQKAYDRDKALKAIIAVSPNIQAGLISPMIADAEDFYEVNRGLNDIRVNNAVYEISKAKKAFQRLAYSGKDTESLQQMAGGINEMLVDPSIKAAMVSTLKLDKGKFKGANSGALTDSQLTDIRDRIASGVKQIKAVDQDAAQYRELLGGYVILLHKVGQSLDALVQAARQKKSYPPDSSGLLNAVIRVEQAYIAYRQTE